MIMVYLVLAFVPVGIAYMIISASKRNAVTKRAKRAGGVFFQYGDPGLLSKIRYSLAWILITGVNLLSNMTKLGYDRGDGILNPRNQVIFYGIVLVIFVVSFLYSLQQYLKYNEFRLCAKCFYLGGVRYSRKQYSYTIDGDTLIFKGNRVEKRIVIPEKKREEVLGILEEYYTNSENG